MSGIALLGYLGICGYLYIRQAHFIFFPTVGLAETPADRNLAYQDVWLTPVEEPTSATGSHLGSKFNLPGWATAQTAKRDRIHGWWIPTSTSADSPSRITQTAPDVLLYLHGNSGGVDVNLNHAARFQRWGLSVLLIDYRGYGLSTGAFPSEQQVYQDAETAWHYLVHTQNIAPHRIIIYGHSLGGAIATELASRHPDAAGLIVESSFTSIEAMATVRGRYSLIPVNLILHQRFDSIQKAPALEMPSLFIHGLQDSEIPYQMSEQLYQSAPEPKQLWLVPGAGHADTASLYETAYRDRIRQFIHLIQQHQAQPFESTPLAQ
ncbi:MAG: alpha/beta hydrolase [Thainema sp.]